MRSTRIPGLVGIFVCISCALASAGPLHKAILTGNLTEVQALLDKGADINEADETGAYPLHCAVVADDRRIAALLIEKGANLSLINKSRQTPLLLAMSLDNPAMAKFLIERGADAKCYDNVSSTPLHWAADKGYLNLATYLLDKAEINAKDNSRCTPLDKAVAAEQREVAVLLLDRGGTLDALQVIARARTARQAYNCWKLLCDLKILDKPGAFYWVTEATAARMRKDIMEKKNTVSAADLAAMYGTRNIVYRHVAQQSVPEMIASLGHLYYGLTWTQTSFDTAVSMEAITAELALWGPTMSRDLRVLRLIEEEKSQPDSVRPLLKSAIRDALAGYASVARAVRDTRSKALAMSGPRASDDGLKYEQPFFEMLRRDYLIRAGFYVLANGGEVPGELLDAWMALVDSSRPPCETDVWLISAYWSLQTGQEDAHSAKHREIVGGKIAVGGKRSVPAWWSGLTDHSEIVGQTKRDDLSGTPCIELLDIPSGVHLTQEEIKGVIANFRAHIAHAGNAP